LILLGVEGSNFFDLRPPENAKIGRPLIESYFLHFPGKQILSVTECSARKLIALQKIGMNKFQAYFPLQALGNLVSKKNTFFNPR